MYILRYKTSLTRVLNTWLTINIIGFRPVCDDEGNQYQMHGNNIVVNVEDLHSRGHRHRPNISIADLRSFRMNYHHSQINHHVDSDDDSDEEVNELLENKDDDHNVSNQSNSF